MKTTVSDFKQNRLRNCSKSIAYGIPVNLYGLPVFCTGNSIFWTYTAYSETYTSNRKIHVKTQFFDFSIFFILNIEFILFERLHTSIDRSDFASFSLYQQSVSST